MLRMQKCVQLSLQLIYILSLYRKKVGRLVELDAIKTELSGFEKPLLEMGDSL